MTLPRATHGGTMARVVPLERQMSRFLRKPPTVRGAASVIVTTTALIVVASGLLMRLLDHREYPNIFIYRRTLSGDRRKLLERYRYVHAARKVVGVGSVGTRAYIMLLLGRDDNDPLFLQVKEAEAAVLEPFLGKSEFANHGQRVVEGQRLTQAASDIMLGHIRAEGIDGVQRDFYVRQLWDAKGSALVDLMEPPVLRAYAEACGAELARAHARSGDAIAIASYLGNSETFDRAIAQFAEAYADQNERDYETLTKAAKAGEIQTETGV